MRSLGSAGSSERSPTRGRWPVHPGWECSSGYRAAVAQPVGGSSQLLRFCTVKILAVCLGNICRSPAAEAAIAEAAEVAGLEVHVESAGTGAYHIGEPPDRRMRAAGAASGLEIDGTARQFDPADFGRFDLIVVMDHGNMRDVVALAPDPSLVGRVRLFRSFDPMADPSDLDVPDPYYGGRDGFDEVIRMVRRAAAGLVEELQGLQ